MLGDPMSSDAAVTCSGSGGGGLIAASISLISVCRAWYASALLLTRPSLCALGFQSGRGRSPPSGSCHAASSSRLIRDAAELAILASAVGRAFVRTLTNPCLREIKVVNLGADPAKELRRPFWRYKAEIVGSRFEPAVEYLARLLARKD